MVRLLTEGDVLVKSCDDDSVTGDSLWQRKDGNPFNFSPQLIQLHQDHELLEVT